MAVIQNHQADDDQLSRRIRADLRSKGQDAQDAMSSARPDTGKSGDSVMRHGSTWLIVAMVIVISVLLTLFLQGI